MFDSGFGDGSYFSYVGFDSEGDMSICNGFWDFGWDFLVRTYCIRGHQVRATFSPLYIVILKIISFSNSPSSTPSESTPFDFRSYSFRRLMAFCVWGRGKFRVAMR